MKIKQVLLITMFCMSMGGKGLAQEVKTMSLTFVPTNLFIGIARMDAEVYFKKSQHAIVVAPEYYFADVSEMQINSSQSKNITSLNFYGAGAELQYKIYLDKIREEEDAYRSRIYMAYGLAGHFFSHRYEANMYYTYDYDGITYYTYGLKSTTDRIERYKVGFYLGIQKRADRFVFDAYSGLSYQFSTVQYGNENAILNYEDKYLSYGYEGFKPRLGLKIGLFLF